MPTRSLFSLNRSENEHFTSIDIEQRFDIEQIFV